jgi:hypothetical protein
MDEAAEKIMEGLREAVAFSSGDTPAPRLHIGRHSYVPEGADEWNRDMTTAPRDGRVILIRIGISELTTHAARWHERGCWEVFPGGFWTTVDSWRLLPD